VTDLRPVNFAKVDARGRQEEDFQMAESPHDHHNRVATEIANRIISEFAPSDRFVVVESIIAAVIGSIRAPVRLVPKGANVPVAVARG
jgi:hypothetical protein